VLALFSSAAAFRIAAVGIARSSLLRKGTCRQVVETEQECHIAMAAEVEGETCPRVMVIELGLGNSFVVELGKHLRVETALERYTEGEVA
jgi:hypothetical protein